MQHALFPPGERGKLKNTHTRSAGNSSVTVLSYAVGASLRAIQRLFRLNSTRNEDTRQSARNRHDYDLDSVSLFRDGSRQPYAVIGRDQERDVVARDGRDIRNLEILRDVVGAWLEQIKDLEPLEHPDSRWHPADLRDALLGTQINLQAELDRLHRQPLLVLA